MELHKHTAPDLTLSAIKTLAGNAVQGTLLLSFLPPTNFFAIISTLSQANPGAQMMAKILTLRLTDYQSKHLQTLIDSRDDINTASKMLVHCMLSHTLMLDTQNSNLGSIEALENQVGYLEGLIGDAKAAAQLLCDAATHKSFLD